MSLLQKASIITTPTAYAEDYLYSIKPAYDLGSELVVNGDGSSTTGWSLAYANTTLSINNNNLRATANASGAYGLSQSLSLNTSKKYIITADINVDNASGGTGNLRIATNVQLGTNVTTLSTATGITTTTFTPTASTMYIGIVDTASSSSNYVEISNISVKEVTDADFDFDRNSTGTRVNEDYLIEDVPYNLVSQSNQFDTTWTLFHGGTVTGGQPDKDYGNNAWKLNAVSTQSFSGIHQARTFTGVTTASIFAKAGTLSHLGIVNFNGTGFAVWFNLSNGTIGTKDASVSNANMQNLGDGWYRCSFTQDVSAAGYFQLKPSDGELTPSTTSGFVYIQDAQLVKGDQPKDYLKTTDRLDIPRIDYTNGEPSILLEPSRSNIIIYSQDYTQWSSSLSPTVTSNFAISPEGITNADKITASHNNSSKFIGFTLATSTVHTASVFLKNIDSTQTRIEVYAASWSYPNFEISWNGYIPSTLSSNNVSNIQYQEYTNNWWRVSYQFTTDSSITSYNTYIYPDRVNASKSILAFGSQLEAGNNATSLIHTSGSTATRSKDSFPNPLGANGTPTGNKAVIYLEIASTPTTPLPQKNFIGFVNGTTNQYGLYHWGSTDSNKFGFNTWNGDAYGITGADYLINGEFNKIAGLFDFTNFTNNKLYINGKKQSISQVRNTTVQRSAAGLGITAPTANQDPVGNYKCVMMFDEELTDEELEKLTGYNNHELYMNYYNRLSYLGLVEEYNVESDINNYIL